MRGTVKFKDYLKKQLKNPEFKKAFDEEEIYASLAIQIAKIRQKERLTQAELAKRLDTTQQTVCRLGDIRPPESAEKPRLQPPISHTTKTPF